MKGENARIAEEERRKTLTEETKHAKHVSYLITRNILKILLY